MKRTAFLFVFALALVLAFVLGFSADSVYAEPTPGTQVHLPILNYIAGEEACDVLIEVQNVGTTFTKAMLFFWGEPGPCPPQCNGPFKVECSGLIKPGSTWNFIGPGVQVPAGAKKAIVFSLRADQWSEATGLPIVPDDVIADEVCEVAQSTIRSDCDDYRRFKKSFDEDGGAGWAVSQFGIAPADGIAGEPLAVEVVRKCQTTTMTAPVTSAYSGVSTEMTGVYDPVFGGFAYYVPLVYGNALGLNTFLYIQNAGLECTSVELWFKEQDNCLRATICEIFALSPGETYQFDVSSCVPFDFVGSVWIRTSVPTAIAVDNYNDDILMTYHGKPAELNYTFDPNAAFFTAGSQVNYGPLIYREFQGWDSTVQVQNLSSVVNAKVKVYFIDNSGDIITTLVDWICPRGSQTFFLPVINNLPGHWVGQVRVESQEWWSPGDPKVLPPNIVSVAELIHYSDPARTSQLEGVSYNLFPEQQAFDWQIGSGNGGLESGVGLIGIPSLLKDLKGTGYTTELAIANLVPKPGFTDFAIYIYDQNGLLDFVCEKLNEKQVEYINLDSWGYINPGFKGSAVISAVFWEHPVTVTTPGGPGVFVRNLVGLAAVKVERQGTVLSNDIPGDEASASEGFPVPPGFDFEGPQAPGCPGVGEGRCFGEFDGQVVDVNGNPFPGVLVQVFPAGFGPGGGVPPVFTTSTDVQGHWNGLVPTPPGVVTFFDIWLTFPPGANACPAGPVLAAAGVGQVCNGYLLVGPLGPPAGFPACTP